MAIGSSVTVAGLDGTRKRNGGGGELFGRLGNIVLLVAVVGFRKFAALRALGLKFISKGRIARVRYSQVRRPRRPRDANASQWTWACASWPVGGPRRCQSR